MLWRHAATAASAGLCPTNSDRYEELGEEGLMDRLSRPHYSPRATKSEATAEIVYLRQHYCFGPLKITMYLKRYCDIKMSSSGVWRVLDRLGLKLTEVVDSRGLS